MSAADRPAGSDDAESVAAACRDAGFVRLVSGADGDAVAATGLLGRAFTELGVPFQASVAAGDASRETDADVTVTVGRDDPAADAAVAATPRPASETAAAVARELGTDPDPVLALAGVAAAGEVPGGDLLEAATETGATRRPGVAIPTADLADGLAHTTLVHAPFSGDPGAASERVAALDLPADRDGGAHRRVASLLALSVAGTADATPRAAEALERALHPYGIEAPFATIGGYADVLDAGARTAPGTALALAFGHDVREAALDAWRTHGERAHRTLRSATTGRYDGLFVARASATDLDVPDAGAIPAGTVARLLADFRSPEPVALFVTDGHAAAARTDDRGIVDPMREAANAVDGTATGNGNRASARFETDTAAFIVAFREAL